MSSDTKWKVVTFFVKTNTANGAVDALYANGRMQVPVSIFIKAVVRQADDTKRYNLTQAELDSIQLVHYDNPTDTLSGTWTYSAQRNDFSCTLSAANSISRAVPAMENMARARRALSGVVQDDGSDSSNGDSDGDNGTPQLKVYRVSTSSVENKNIGASIKQPNGKVVTTHSSDFDSRVTLEGKEPITYTTDNITVTKENPANGSFTVDWAGAGTSGTSTYPWSQDNYYVSTMHHALHKVEIYNFDTTGSGNNTDSDSRLANCYAKRTPGTELKLFFVWDQGPEATKTAGMNRKTTNVKDGVSYKLDIHAYAAIQVNQKNRALCLSRLAFQLPHAVWGSEWSYDTCGFNLYDSYGNKGTFYARMASDPYYATTPTNSDSVVIGNANPDPSAAGSSTATT